MHATHSFYFQSFDQEKIFVTVSQNAPQVQQTFLLIHGLTGDAVAYEDVATYLLDHHPSTAVYSLDLRGHGHSSYRFPASADNLYDLYVKDIQALLAELELPRLVMVGQSMAGSIIQEFIAQDKFNKVSGIVLISATLRIPRLLFSAPQYYRSLVKFSQNSNFPVRRRQHQDHIKYRYSWDYSPRRILSDIHFSYPAKYLLLWLAVFGWQASPTIQLNSDKVLFIAGKNDWVIPTFLQRTYRKRFPQAQYVEVPSNHNAIVNIPEIIAQTILTFTQKITRKS